MGEFSVWLAVEFNDVFNTERAQELWNHNAANRIDCIDSYCETGFADCVDIHKVKREHLLYVAEIICVVVIFLSEAVDVGKAVGFAFGYAEHFLALRVIEEFSLFVQ